VSGQTRDLERWAKRARPISFLSGSSNGAMSKRLQQDAGYPFLDSRSKRSWEQSTPHDNRAAHNI
jgi:hypothetical protein